jgi:hypothetical protein
LSKDDAESTALATLVTGHEYSPLAHDDDNESCDDPLLLLAPGAALVSTTRPKGEV